MRHLSLLELGAAVDKKIEMGRGVTLTEPPRLTHLGSDGYMGAEFVVVRAHPAAVPATVNAGDARARQATTAMLVALFSSTRIKVGP